MSKNSNFLMSVVCELIEKKEEINLDNIIPKVDNSKTSNDFGFNKGIRKSISAENDSKKSAENNIDKKSETKTSRQQTDRLMENELLELMENELILRSKKQDQLTIETLITAKKKGKNKKAEDNGLSDNTDNEIKAAASKNSELDKRPEALGYEHHTTEYLRVMNDYLNEPANTVKAQNDPYAAAAISSKQQRGFGQGDEIINYKERIEYVRAVVMNSIMGAPVNHVEPDTKEKYQMWKNVSKFNVLLSRMYKSSITL